MGKLIAWVIIAALVSLVVVATQFEARPKGASAASASTATGPAAPEGFVGLMGKVLMGSPADQRASGLSNVRMLATGFDDRVRLAILLAEIQDQAETLTLLEGLAAEPGVSPDRLAEVQALRALYAEGTAIDPGSEAGRSLLARHPWFGKLALSRGEPSSALRTQALEAASRVTGVLLAATIAGVLLIALSLGLFITAIVLLATGRLRPHYRHDRAALEPRGSAYLEIFALFLVAFLVLQLVVGALSASVGMVALLAMWLALPVIVWPTVRGHSWAQTRLALGLHARGRGIAGVLRELVLGAAGYLALLPIVGAGILCTLMLVALSGVVRSAMGLPPPEQPTHPIAGMLAQASTAEILVLISLATVWAPVVEELMFRGAFYHHLRGRWGTVVSATFVGVIFAAIHPQGLLAIPALASIGVSLALLREWRGSIVPSIAAHAVNNGAIVALLVVLLRA
jgi:membrane protease YdiL (CAAX protease family)